MSRGMNAEERLCPRRSLHTDCPDGYVAWHEWAEQKSHRHEQVKCPGCGRFRIWKRTSAAPAVAGSDREGSE